MRPMFRLIRCFAILVALLAALWVVPGTAMAHGGHNHSHHSSDAAKAPVKAEKAGATAIQAELRAVPVKLSATAIDVGADCDDRGCCPGPCAACGGLVLSSQSAPTPPTISTALGVVDMPRLAGMRPYGIRKPPKSFA